jgi:hypothetical protein
MHSDGKGFSLVKGGRIYFATAPMDTFEGNQDKYWKTPLLNNHFSYDIDISTVGCHCNAAAYFDRMPGPATGNGGDYYCDANFGNKQWCPEYDTFEGNKYTFASTVHSCDGDGSNWW